MGRIQRIHPSQQGTRDREIFLGFEDDLIDAGNAYLRPFRNNNGNVGRSFFGKTKSERSSGRLRRRQVNSDKIQEGEKIFIRYAVQLFDHDLAHTRSQLEQRHAEVATVIGKSKRRLSLCGNVFSLLPLAEV